MKAVFDTKAESIYDDDVAHRYHFPSRYANVVRECVGDWIVYRQPRAGGGSKAYFAVARVERVDEDKASSGHYYAIMSHFLPFDRNVPWLRNGRYAEAALRDLEDTSRLGLYLRGRSVRRLEESDFAAIVRTGLAETLSSSDAAKLSADRGHLDAHMHDHVDMPAELPRRIEEMLVNRKVRDASFRRQVCDAYQYRCAVTDLKIIDDDGRAEVQAAHIMPVSVGGPDTIQNGIALSGTVHWLFDRHLISLDEDYRLLVLQNRIPIELRTLFRRAQDRISLPTDPRLWPNQMYIAEHRKAFSGA